MRTTVDLPEDLHRLVRSLARDTSRSLSEVVVELMRRGVGSGDDTGGAAGGIARSKRSGLPVVHLGRVVTSEDVRSLEDDPS